MNQPEELNPHPELPEPIESFAELERHLTQVLCRVAPPEGFVDRVVKQAAQPQSPARTNVVQMTGRQRLWTGWKRWTSGAIAAALLAGLFIAEHTRESHQRKEAERAERQFEVALHITGETLEQTRQQLQEAGVDLGN